MLKKITPQEVEKLRQEKALRLVDIREPYEYASVHIQDSYLVPQAILDKHPLREKHDPEEIQLVFFCRSGSRVQNSEKLIAKLEPEGLVMEGGLNAWIKAGLAVERSKISLPIFRQIQIGAGALVVLGILGETFWHPMYLLSAFVGIGLIFAGVTGFCGMAVLLGKMPWNKQTEA